MKRLPSLRGEGKMNMWSGENLSLSLGDYTLCNQKPSERGGAPPTKYHRLALRNSRDWALPKDASHKPIYSTARKKGPERALPILLSGRSRR